MLPRFEAHGRPGRRGRSDTVTDAFDTVIESRGLAPDTVTSGLGERFPPSATRTLQASSLQAIKGGRVMPYFATVAMSVSAQFFGREGRFLPMSSDLLLTIEWE